MSDELRGKCPVRACVTETARSWGSKIMGRDDQALELDERKLIADAINGLAKLGEPGKMVGVLEVIAMRVRDSPDAFCEHGFPTCEERPRRKPQKYCEPCLKRWIKSQLEPKL